MSQVNKSVSNLNDLKQDVTGIKGTALIASSTYSNYKSSIATTCVTFNSLYD